MEKVSRCPLCDEEYNKKEKRILTHHHVWPKLYYHGRGPLVEVCSACHQEFNHNNPMNPECRWSKKQALWRWIRFCQSKGKNLFDAYPEMFKELIG